MEIKKEFNAGIIYYCFLLGLLGIVSGFLFEILLYPKHVFFEGDDITWLFVCLSIPLLYGFSFAFNTIKIFSFLLLGIGIGILLLFPVAIVVPSLHIDPTNSFFIVLGSLPVIVLMMFCLYIGRKIFTFFTITQNKFIKIFLFLTPIILISIAGYFFAF